MNLDHFRSQEAIRSIEYDRLDPGLEDDDDIYCEGIRWQFIGWLGEFRDAECGNPLMPGRPYCEACEPEEE